MGSQAFIRAAAIYERRGQLDTAENLIAKTAHQFPKDGVVLYNLGRMQALRGRLSEAVASMEKARDLNPTYCLTYFALARIYDKQGEEDAALQALHDGLAINPDDPHLLSLASEWQGKHS
jgi:Flp pilus assembly protein TadD